MNDLARLAIVKRYQNVIQLPDRCFENIVDLAAEICGTSAAFITFIDATHVSVQASVGVRVKSSVARSGSLFELCLLSTDCEQRNDENGLPLPIVLDGETARFFASVPIVTAGGFVVGSLSVAGQDVKILTLRQQLAIKRLAELVTEHLETKFKAFASLRSAETITLLNSITAIANEATQLKPSVQKALAEVCRYFGSSIGHYDEAGGGEGIWYLLDPTIYEQFLMIREQGSSEADDRAIFRFPVHLRSESIGTVELFLTSTALQDRNFDTVANHFSAQIARLTERFRAEKANDAYQKFLDAALENLSDGVVACNAAGELTLFNKAMRDFHMQEIRTDISHDQLTQYYGYYHADGKTLMRRDELPLIRALHGEVIKDFDLVIVSRSGKKRSIRSSSRPMHDRDGQLLGAVATLTDLTETETALSKLEATKRTLESLIETSPAGIIVFDRDMRVTIWNSGSEKLFGWTKEEVLGASVKDASDPMSVETRKTLETLLLTRGRVEIESPRYCKNGSTVMVKASVVPIIDEKDEVSGFISVMIDISDLAKKETDLIAINNALKAADEAKSRFLAKMSHELCTPLNHVIGMSEYVLETKLDNEQKKFLDEINRSGENLLTMVNRILEFSRVEVGDVSIAHVDFELEKILSEVHAEFASQAGAKDLNFGVQLVSGSANQLARASRFSGDPLRIRQVLENLVGNAIKFTETGFVSVKATLGETSSGRTRLFVDVEDSGIGIAPEKIQHVFDAFSQADESSTRKFGGAGLGLSISRGVIEKMKGMMGVESELSKGSRFWFYVDLDACGNQDIVNAGSDLSSGAA